MDRGPNGGTQGDVVWSRRVSARALRSPLSITFAFVATHNHFVLDRGGKVFNRSAPVIKLPDTATEADHLALLGLLNSSTACFWMKQVPRHGDPPALAGGLPPPGGAAHRADRVGPQHRTHRAPGVQAPLVLDPLGGAGAGRTEGLAARPHRDPLLGPGVRHAPGAPHHHHRPPRPAPARRPGLHGRRRRLPGPGGLRPAGPHGGAGGGRVRPLPAGAALQGHGAAQARTVGGDLDAPAPGGCPRRPGGGRVPGAPGPHRRARRDRVQGPGRGAARPPAGGDRGHPRAPQVPLGGLPQSPPTGACAAGWTCPRSAS